MDDLLKKKEKELSRLELEEEIAGKRRAIAEQKAIERKMKGEGKNWKKILGVVKGLRPNQETIHTLYSLGSGPDSLKEFSNPRHLRKL